MVKENNLVRVLRACETMGNATVICSDKTGTLTQNKMTVVAAAWSFDENSPDPEKQTPPDNISEAFKELSQSSKDLIVKSIALNSTAFEEEKNSNKEFVGSKTEVAMLELAKDHLGMNTREERANAEIVQMFPFESSRKCMGVVYREPSTVGYRLLVKGAAEMLLKSATSTAKGQVGTSIVTERLTEDKRLDIHERINCYAEQSLRTIGMVYKDLPCWPPTTDQLPKDDSSEPDFESLLKDMTWIGVVGIQDPLRPEVPDAIQKCNSAGVQVKMVSGDNLKTATAIARACGILTDGIVMEGPKFRQLSDAELDEVAPRLQVLARSSPDDKRVLVEHLKRLGETVAVTGDGTNDGPALKTADVGFSMGIAGTEVAKEASSIILLDDNFKSIITALAWGRAVNDAVSKFLQVIPDFSTERFGSNTLTRAVSNYSQYYCCYTYLCVSCPQWLK
jgi:Ca2+-transporting ATPase